MLLEIQEQPKKAIDAAGQRMRVLVADDDPDTLMTLGVLLGAEGFEMKLVLNGEPVATVVDYFKPHVVLLDIGMPDRTGYYLAQELRAHYGEQCPVLIALTGRGSASDKAQSKMSGFHYHVTKPYDPAELLRFLASLQGRADPS